jgi:hypothetical protein
MSTNDYHFITHWRVKGTLEEVYNILTNTVEFPRWCPSVYLSVTEVHAGGADHIGFHAWRNRIGRMVLPSKRPEISRAMAFGASSRTAATSRSLTTGECAPGSRS